MTACIKFFVIVGNFIMCISSYMHYKCLLQFLNYYINKVKLCLCDFYSLEQVYARSVYHIWPSRSREQYRLIGKTYPAMVHWFCASNCNLQTFQYYSVFLIILCGELHWKPWVKYSGLLGPSLVYLIPEAMGRYDKIHITSSNIRDNWTGGGGGWLCIPVLAFFPATLSD